MLKRKKPEEGRFQMDMLDQLINYAQLSGCINVQCLFQGDWFVQHKARQGQGLVHIVTQGQSYLRVNGEPILLKKGDVIFFPRAVAHTLSNEFTCSNSQAKVSEQNTHAYFTQKQRGDVSQPDFTLFCARFFYDSHADLFAVLPEMIHLSCDEAQLAAVVSLLQNEAMNEHQATASVVDALSRILFVFLLRTFLAQEQGKQALKGILNGWQDRRLRPLISQILAEPEAAWQIEQMASIAAVSRAQLSRLFQAQMGISPYAFVHRTRLQKGAMLLRQTQESVLGVALSCGFQTETHFGRAFKKAYGLTPKMYRLNTDPLDEAEAETADENAAETIEFH